MIQKQNNEIFSTEGKYVHIKNTDNYFKRGLAIGLSVEQCEAEAREWLKEHPNGDLPQVPQVEDDENEQ